MTFINIVYIYMSIGLTSLEEGEVNANEIKLTSSSISRMSFAKDPAVIKVIINTGVLLPLRSAETAEPAI
jgi:hypothetical protein